MSPRDSTRGQLRMRVGEADTATAMGSGDVPALATPRAVALCEGAACAALAEIVHPGQTTVGTWIELEHLAPSRIGAEVEALAVLTESDGRGFEFDVSLSDGERLVARGRHRRQLVDRERFLQSLLGR
jgi:fluoroacetyl-CoA thioesterase